MQPMKKSEGRDVVVTDPVLTMREAAAIAKQSEFTLRRRGKAGKLTILKLSANRNGIRASELNRYLDALETR